MRPLPFLPLLLLPACSDPNVPDDTQTDTSDSHPNDDTGGHTGDTGGHTGDTGGHTGDTGGHTG
ncbi:MAG: hypothetical protein JXB39_10400, partial [Deltaproteobacteria bacterium]|nr:hypothetical protein [Deltaproteobacteria bacterium]